MPRAARPRNVRIGAQTGWMVPAGGGGSDRCLRAGSCPRPKMSGPMMAVAERRQTSRSILGPAPMPSNRRRAVSRLQRGRRSAGENALRGQFACPEAPSRFRLPSPFGVPGPFGLPSGAVPASREVLVGSESARYPWTRPPGTSQPVWRRQGEAGGPRRDGQSCRPNHDVRPARPVSTKSARPAARPRDL